MAELQSSSWPVVWEPRRGVTDRPLTGEFAAAYGLPTGWRDGDPPTPRPRKGARPMSDAAARALSDPDGAMYAYEAAKARGATNQEAMDAAYQTMHPGPPVEHKANLPGFVYFLDYLRSGGRSLEAKANLVEDATGRVLVPEDLTIDILREARRVNVFRRLASVRPTVRASQQAGLIGAATVGWGKQELGTAITDANLAPESPVNEIDVHNVQAEALVGVNLLDDSPAAARDAIVEAIGSAIGESEETKFAAGTGTNEPKGLALAGNVTRVPAAQKVAVSTSNTPTTAQLVTIPWKLPTRYRDDAVWLLHPTSAEKITALTFTNGDAVWPNPGPNGPGLLGWPAHVVDGLPDPATAGTGDASVWFLNLERAYRVVERQRVTVQVLRERHALDGIVGLIVRARVGGDMVRPEACAIYTQ